MTIVGLAELKAKLSAYLKRVRSGQEVLITDRGMPVAKLVPLDGKKDPNKRRERLAKGGLVRPGRGGRVSGELRRPPEGDRMGASVLTELLAEREETR